MIFGMLLVLFPFAAVLLMLFAVCGCCSLCIVADSDILVQSVSIMTAGI